MKHEYKVGDKVLWLKSSASGEVGEIIEIIDGHLLVSSKYWGGNMYLAPAIQYYIRPLTKLEKVLR